MELARVEIKNFRSIADGKIGFSNSCLVLVGINESGKSNILRALSLLSPGQEIDLSDIRQPLPDEPPVSESYVRFVFKLSESDRDSILDSINGSYQFYGDDSKPIVVLNNKAISIKELLTTQSEGLWIVSVNKKMRYSSTWAFVPGMTMSGKWIKPKSTSSKDVLITINGKQVKLGSLLLVDSDQVEISEPEHFEPANALAVITLIQAEVRKYVKDNLPLTVYWAYDEKNLLPSRIKLADFCASPDLCLPLKHMFLLADISQIKEKVDAAREGQTHGVRNLLNRVAIRSTAHFRKIWKDYKGISFDLQENGENVDIAIKDKFNLYAMDQRSDGFKRFVAFLLMISAQVRTKRLANALLLIDEPGLSLHPSGERYLRDELLEISRANRVVYSTHSIFMVDGANISRHIIVRKKDEKTVMETATESNFVEEEVLYNALGYSVFESLAEMNIVFEGWRDKRLFTVAIQRLPAGLKPIKQYFESFGLCHAHGVPSIKNVTPMLELGRRGCLIISDSDSAAVSGKRHYVQNLGYGLWLMYNDVMPNGPITAEDFLKYEVIVEWLVSVVGKKPPKETVSRIRVNRGRLETVRSYLEGEGISQEEAKEHINRLKSDLFANLQFSHVDEIYFDFLKHLHEQLCERQDGHLPRKQSVAVDSDGAAREEE